MSSFKEDITDSEVNQDNYSSSSSSKNEEDKLDLANLLNMLQSKNIKCVHLFSCEKRILFLLVETQFSYLLIYIPSKFPVYYNNKTLPNFIPMTDIKIDEDEEDDNYVYDNKKLYSLKKGLESKVQYFTNSNIKLSYISKKCILLINRHNEVEKFMFNTDVTYDSSYWVIDLENLYMKINNIDNEIKDISCNIINNFYNSFETNKSDTIKFLTDKLNEINIANKNILPFDNYSKRINQIRNKIQQEKTSINKTSQQDEFREKNNRIENDYICDLLKWENFFNQIKKIK
jgi:hypothetical protein